MFHHFSLFLFLFLVYNVNPQLLEIYRKHTTLRWNRRPVASCGKWAPGREPVLRDVRELHRFTGSRMWSTAGPGPKKWFQETSARPLDLDLCHVRLSGQVYSSLPEILRFLGLICLEAVNMSQTVAEHLLKDLEPELSANHRCFITNYHWNLLRFTLYIRS